MLGLPRVRAKFRAEKKIFENQENFFYQHREEERVIRLNVHKYKFWGDLRQLVIRERPGAKGWG